MFFHMCTFDWLSLLAVSYDGVGHKIIILMANLFPGAVLLKRVES